MNRIETIVVSENRKTADLYKYIKSKDVRKYLKENNYQFSLLQAAYLIYHDWSSSLSGNPKDYDSLPTEHHPVRRGFLRLWALSAVSGVRFSIHREFFPLFFVHFLR